MLRSSYFCFDDVLRSSYFCSPESVCCLAALGERLLPGWLRGELWQKLSAVRGELWQKLSSFAKSDSGVTAVSASVCSTNTNYGRRARLDGPSGMTLGG